PLGANRLKEPLATHALFCCSLRQGQPVLWPKGYSRICRCQALALLVGVYQTHRRIRHRIGPARPTPRTESLQRPMPAPPTSWFPSEHSQHFRRTAVLIKSNDGAEAVAPLANRHHWIAVPCLRTRAPRARSHWVPN